MWQLPPNLSSKLSLFWPRLLSSPFMGDGSFLVGPEILQRHCNRVIRVHSLDALCGLRGGNWTISTKSHRENTGGLCVRSYVLKLLHWTNCRWLPRSRLARSWLFKNLHFFVQNCSIVVWLTGKFAPILIQSQSSRDGFPRALWLREAYSWLVDTESAGAHFTKKDCLRIKAAVSGVMRLRFSASSTINPYGRWFAWVSVLSYSF